MKTSIPKNTKLSNSYSSRPFFDNRRKGDFFSQLKEIEKPFFQPSGIQPKLVQPSLSIQAKQHNCPTRNPKKTGDIANALCVTSKSRSMSPKCKLTKQQEKILLDSKSEALSKIMNVEFELFGSYLNYQIQETATELSKTFFGSRTTTQGILDIFRQVIKVLSGSRIRFQGATCGDKNCSGDNSKKGMPNTLPLSAYVTAPGQMPIYICPKAFLDKSDLSNTILHEAFHLVGITHKVGFENEKYCPDESVTEVSDCDIPCGDENSASTWVKFVNCFELINTLKPLLKVLEIIKVGEPPSIKQNKKRNES